MSGLDILVIAMGVIAGGVGIYCYVTEHLHADRDSTIETKEDEAKEDSETRKQS